MNSGTKHRRRRLSRAPLEREFQLTQRDLAIMNALADYGGCLTTIQLAMLFWRPSLEKKLLWWKIEKQVVEELVAQHPLGYLNERIELLKWLLKIKQNHPAILSTLDQPFKNVAEVEPKVWLLKAIRGSIEPPEVFLSRPKPASRWVSRACTSRLRLLYDASYIESEEQRTRLSEGRAPLLWFLTRKGRDEVALLRKVEPKDIDWRRAGSFSPSFLEHRIKTNDLRISINLAGVRHGFEIKMWLDDHQLRRIHSRPVEKVVLTRPKDHRDPDGEVIEQKVSVVADGYFWLDTGKNYHQFLEIDLRTVTGQYSDPGLKDWARKIRAFSEYYKSGQYQRCYPEAGSSMRVLTVTTGETRLRNLKRITERVVGEDQESGLNRYWFTTFDKIAPTFEDFFDETVLTGKIWSIAGRDDLRPMVW